MERAGAFDVDACFDVASRVGRFLGRLEQDFSRIGSNAASALYVLVRSRNVPRAPVPRSRQPTLERSRVLLD
jgi:hypothetical protein